MRAYLVAGPESSGNRYMTRCLVSAGCAGRGEVKQPWDGKHHFLVLPETPERLVVFRSVPHGRLGPKPLWPDIAGHVQILRDHGYDLDILLMDRDPEFVARSQVNTGHADSLEQAYGRIDDAWSHIYRHISHARAWENVTKVLYRFLGNSNYRLKLSKQLDLPPFTESFIDGDAKYREGAA